jgi:hypothetical protein
MTLKQPLLRFINSVLTIFLLVSCDTTKNIYKSYSSKKDYITINAVTLSHCGCTEIYVESFKNGKQAFQIFYNDNIARKTIFNYSLNDKIPTETSLLATANENFTIPFDSVDAKIFSIIDSAIVKKQGIIYPVRRTVYKGFIPDTSITR